MIVDTDMLVPCPSFSLVSEALGLHVSEGVMLSRGVQNNLEIYYAETSLSREFAKSTTHFRERNCGVYTILGAIYGCDIQNSPKEHMEVCGQVELMSSPPIGMWVYWLQEGDFSLHNFYLVMCRMLILGLV